MVPPSTQERLRGHLEGHRKWVEDMAAAEALLKQVGGGVATDKESVAEQEQATTSILSASQA